MSTWIISYDLRKLGRSDAPLHAAIRSLGPAVRPLPSLWIVLAERSELEIRDYLSRFVDARDGLIVVLSGNIGAWHGIDASLKDWLTQNL